MVLGCSNPQTGGKGMSCEDMDAVAESLAGILGGIWKMEHFGGI